MSGFQTPSMKVPRAHPRLSQVTPCLIRGLGIVVQIYKVVPSYGRVDDQNDTHQEQGDDYLGVMKPGEKIIHGDSWVKAARFC